MHSGAIGSCRRWPLTVGPWVWVWCWPAARKEGQDYKRLEGAIVPIMLPEPSPPLTQLLSPSLPPPFPPHLDAMDSPITGWLLHHSLQLPLFIPLPPLLVSLVQSKAAGCCLALALMGKLDPRGLIPRQIQSPGRAMSFIRVISEWPL